MNDTPLTRNLFYRTRPCNRQDYILAQCTGKKVLDIGCTCWPNTKRRMEHETLLHERLYKVASLVHGIDVDQEGVDYMRNRGFNVYTIDATDLQNIHSELEAVYDVVLLGDVIEHVTNPKEMLVAASSRVAPKGQLIVTTDNSFHLYGFLKALMRGECTHPDHVAHYSPMNLEELFRRASLQIFEMRGYYEDPYKEGLLKRMLRRLERAAIRVFPGTSCGILCRAKRLWGPYRD